MDSVIQRLDHVGQRGDGAVSTANHWIGYCQKTSASMCGYQEVRGEGGGGRG